MVVADINEETARETADTISGEDGIALEAPADVTVEEDCERTIEAATQAWGKLDILVNVAGGGFPGTVVEFSLEDWERVVRLNLASVFLMSKYAVLKMRQSGGGAIVSTSSNAGVDGTARNAAYAAAKGGIIALTKSMARDHVKEGIRVNCVAPGGVGTPLLRRATPELQEVYQLANIFKRLGEPEEIAEVILYLASEQASFVTGQTITAGR